MKIISKLKNMTRLEINNIEGSNLGFLTTKVPDKSIKNYLYNNIDDF